ncbi:DUF2306 domain-containing protein [Gracilimonas sp. BCB1]|uniref:DUF2306 domain-containing protein n=1 Tax=Gracilimonas sp. BCB1 TaxID=3152362 RepID=UPI0032D8E065
MISFHTLMGAIALLSGAFNLVTTKGTKTHRIMGWTYVLSMGALIITSFAIFDLFGGFGPFHVMSMISGVTIALAVYFPLRRHKHKNWLEHHYMWISWSYVGLLMATGSHLFEYGPEGWSGLARAFLYWGLPCIVGASIIYWNKKRLLTKHS